MSAFFDRFFDVIENEYPATAASYQPREKLYRNLICSDTVPLPAALATQAEEIVAAFWELRALEPRKSSLEALAPAMSDPGNKSILMSYDFHVDEAGNLRLIEINTNASSSLLGDAVYKAHGLANRFSPDFRKEIVASFLEEARLAGISGDLNAAIIDEKPSEQKLFIEFLLYQELFEKGGIRTRICDSTMLRFGVKGLLCEGDKIDLVYNRDTDFYFENPKHAAISSAMNENSACISPHPHEYRLLADKERLLELTAEGALEKLDISGRAKEVLSRALIRSWDIRSLGTPDELWAKRKKYFFKPMRSFGGKATYRGSSITKQAFAEMVKGNYTAQEFVPAPIVKLKSMPEDDGFKYDLRFYVYQDHIQLATARTYKGQMTNAQTPGGGTAAIEWV